MAGFFDDIATPVAPATPKVPLPNLRPAAVPKAAAAAPVQKGLFDDIATPVGPAPVTAKAPASTPKVPPAATPAQPAAPKVDIPFIAPVKPGPIAAVPKDAHGNPILTPPHLTQPGQPQTFDPKVIGKAVGDTAAVAGHLLAKQFPGSDITNGAAGAFGGGITDGLTQANADTIPGWQQPAAPSQYADPNLDFGDIKKLTGQLGYQFAHQYPTLAAAMVGGAAGEAVEPIGGAIPGSVIGAGMGAYVQYVRPIINDDINNKHMDPNAAYADAALQASKDAAWTAFSYSLFNLPSMGPGIAGFLKDMALQGVAQAGGGATKQITDNIAAGKDALDGVPDAGINSAFGSVAPAAVYRAAFGILGGAPKPPGVGDAGADSGGPEAPAAGSSSANRPPGPGGGGGDVDAWVTAAQQATSGLPPDALGQVRGLYTTKLQKLGWADADANGVLDRIFGPVPTKDGAGQFGSDWVDETKKFLAGETPANLVKARTFWTQRLKGLGWADADATGLLDQVFGKDGAVQGQSAPRPISNDIKAMGPEFEALATSIQSALAKPGADPAAMETSYRSIMQEHGYPPEVIDGFMDDLFRPANPDTSKPGGSVPKVGPAAPAAPAATIKPDTSKPRGPLPQVAGEPASPADAAYLAAHPDVATATATRPPSIFADIATEAPAEKAPEAPAEPAAGTRTAPVVVAHPDDLTQAEQAVEPEPTPAQAAAGNYPKGHIVIPALGNGFPISIETKAGGVRSGTGEDGTQWQVAMPAAYGYIRNTKAADGEQLDVFVGSDPQSGQAFIVNQTDTAGKFDELKVIVGVQTPEQAKAIYLKSFASDFGNNTLGSIHQLSMDDLKAFLNTPGAAEKPYKPPEEHPGLVIQPLRPGAKPEVMQPAGTVQPKAGQTKIGTNAEGNPVYEDKNGVRSVVKGGMRLTEPVRLVPVRGGGMSYEVDRTEAMDPVFKPLTAAEANAAATAAHADEEPAAKKKVPAQRTPQFKWPMIEDARIGATRNPLRKFINDLPPADFEYLLSTFGDVEYGPKFPSMAAISLDDPEKILGEWRQALAERDKAAKKPKTPQVEAMPATAPLGAKPKAATIHNAHGDALAMAPEAVQEILNDPKVKAALAKPYKVDRTKFIPYMAGYSNDGKTIYIHRDIPTTIKVKSTYQGQIARYIKPDTYLALHEHVEKTLIDVLGYKYQGAHQIAVGAEHAALAAVGLDPESYEAALAPAKRALRGATLDHADVPTDLDVTPYLDSGQKIPAKMDMPEGPHGSLEARDEVRAENGVEPANNEEVATAPNKPEPYTPVEPDETISSPTRQGTQGAPHVSISLKRAGNEWRMGLSTIAGGGPITGTLYPTREDAIRAAFPKIEKSIAAEHKLLALGEHTAIRPSISKAALAKLEPWFDALKAQYAPKGPASAPSAPAARTKAERSIALADALADRLKAGEPLSWRSLQEEATVAFGGTMAEAKFDRKDEFDALELAVNKIVAGDAAYRVDDGDWSTALSKLEKLLRQMPTQTVRTEEMEQFQQFSTPPTYAAAVAYAANLRDGDEVLEPSAGTGSIVAATMRPKVGITANELSDRRADLLRNLVPKAKGTVYTENAEQLDNILPEDVKPTVVTMNPPFSQTAGRMGNKKVIETGAIHIEQALGRLEPGGRLVAIVGRGMAMDAPRFRDWWAEVSKNYNVRANIGVEGKVYAKYGTSFDTRLLVIDKVPPDGNPPLKVDVTTIDDLFKALEPIRNGRTAAPAEHLAGQSSSPQLAAEGQGVGAPGRAPPADAGHVGPGQRGGGGLADKEPQRAPQPDGGVAGVAGGGRPGVAVQQPGGAEPEGAGGRPAARPARGSGAEGSGGIRPQLDLQPAGVAEFRPATGGERVLVENAEPGSQAQTSAITDSLYEAYSPKRLRVSGARPHLGALVESAAMASVDPPLPTYNPALPRSIIDDGLLSLPQLEAVIYAGQAHTQILPKEEGKEGAPAPKAVRKGFFIGDGTGVGKGREVAGIILDNWEKGTTKHVWVSEKKPLINDARRDWAGLGQDPNAIFDVGKTGVGDQIKSAKGIGFITYDTLKGGMSDQANIARGGFIRRQEVTVNGQPGKVRRYEAAKGKKAGRVTVDLANGDTVTVDPGEVQAKEDVQVQSRIDQLVDWLGPDFDGVIAFDEAHNMGNAIDTKGDRGVKEAAQKAMAGLALQTRLPNARVVYVSATGATEVSNLAFATRLGLWGRGTAFADRAAFISAMEDGGLAALELVARDLKQLGVYLARNLSFDGVEYDRIEHTLTPTQREIYDTLAEAWQVVLKNMTAALEVTGGDTNRNAKSAAMSAFWGGHQRFFNQIITSLQMPSVIKSVEKDLAEGRQAVLQLTSTNEASQNRAAAKAKTAEEIEDLDITPRDQIIQLVEKSFPTQQYEEYVDENGNVKSRAVVDAAGNPVQNKEAVAMRDKLIDQLASIKVPQGPLDMILDHFGIDTVAEVTGRGRRFVLKPDENGNIKRTEESRPGSANVHEAEQFQAGKKRILVFSEAGGTGRSYHADNASKSKNARRAHYLVQAGWRADKAVQGLGRSHRTNQASAPQFHLVTTDLSGQKRFISSIARRLAQLGALTKGQRQAGDQGMFSARDNLESQEAQLALRQFYTDLIAGRIEGLSLKAFEDQTGLSLIERDKEGGSVGGLRADPPEITKFLNRLLSMKIEPQNATFQAFADRLDDVVQARQEAGVLDTGLETVRADKIAKISEQKVHTDKASGAETKYVKLALSNRFKPVPFADVAKDDRLKAWATNSQGKVWALMKGPGYTDPQTSAVIDQYRIRSPVSTARLVKKPALDAYVRDRKWKLIDGREAERLWADETAKAPEYVTDNAHIITGAVLPIWDRLKGSPRVIRVQTDAGERFIGRRIPESAITDTLQALGAEVKGEKLSPADLLKSILSGKDVTLANGWRLKRSQVAGEDRLEILGIESWGEGQAVQREGVFAERINYQNRYFIPTGDDGPKVLAKVTEYRPVVTPGAKGAPKRDIQAQRAVGTQTQTTAFKDWFGDSKVVDDAGKPLVVYHGTAGNFDAFDPAKLGASTRHPTSTLGFYFGATPEVADLFTQKVDPDQWPPKVTRQAGANLMPVYLSIKKPFVLSIDRFRDMNATPYGEDFEREQPEAAKRVRDYITENKARLLQQGYDGIHIKGDPAYAERFSGEEYAADNWVAFKPEQIKSATGNRGTFDPTSPNIQAQRGVFGNEPLSASQLTDDTLRQFQNDAQAALSRVAGKRIRVSFFGKIHLPIGAAMGDAKAAAGGVPLSDTVGGTYESREGLPLDSLVSLALDEPDPATAAAHEGMHDVQRHALTSQEKGLLVKDADSPRSTLRKFAAKALGPEVVDHLTQRELEAYAFEQYDRLDRKAKAGSGLSIGIRRAFDKLGAIRGALRHLLGRPRYRSVKQLFAGISRGELGERLDALRAAAEQRGGQPTPELEIEAQRTPKRPKDGEEEFPLSGRAARAYKRDRQPPATEFVHILEDELHEVSMGSQADTAEMRQWLKMAKRGKWDKALDENLYLHGEDREGVPLADDKAAHAWDVVGEPLNDIERDTTIETFAMAREQGASPEEMEEIAASLSEEYMHRMAKGHNARWDILQGADSEGGNPIFGSRTLPRKTSSMNSPVFYAMQNNNNGDRIVVSKGQDGVYRWIEGEPEKIKGSTANSALEMGKKFKIGSGLWTVVRARTPEIEENTETRYHKSFLASKMDNILSLRRVYRSLKLVKALKATPEWRDNAVSIQENQPAGWVTVNVPGLRGYWIHPDIANPINDFLKPPRMFSDETGKADSKHNQFVEKAGDVLGKVDQLLVASLYVSPFPHIQNVAWFWAAGRGLDWYTPRGWHSLMVDGARAIKAVWTQDEVYQDYNRSGAAVIASRVRNHDFAEQILRTAGHEIKKHSNQWQKVAKAAGFSSVAKMLKHMYRQSSNVMWMANDVMVLQRTMEIERQMKRNKAASQSLTPEAIRKKAVYEAATQVPDYRVRSRVAGSRWVSRWIQNPHVFRFSRYHADIFKWFAENVNRMFNPRGGWRPKERIDAMARFLNLAVLLYVVAPLGDALWRWATGDKKARTERSGPGKLIDDVTGWADGQKNWVQAALTFFDPAPILTNLIQVPTNRDLYLEQYGIGSGTIVKPNSSWEKAAQAELNAIADTTGAGSLVQQAAGKKGVGGMLLQQVGVTP